MFSRGDVEQTDGEPEEDGQVVFKVWGVHQAVEDDNQQEATGSQGWDRKVFLLLVQSEVDNPAKSQ